MSRQRQTSTDEHTPARKPTPTFLLELPLRVTPGQAKRLRAHLEAARQLYNALLSEGQQRLRCMRADPGGPAARTIPRTQKLERQRAFAAQRQQYGFSEYALHEAAKGLNCSWIADHVDAVLAQTLASRTYRALNRLCLGQARRVRFKSRGRGLSSMENKRADTGLRFVLQQPEEGNAGYLLWQGDRVEALINWRDPGVAYGLKHRVKYARLVQRQANGPRARGAEQEGQRYFVQLALSGVPYHKPKHVAGQDAVGLDLGPSAIAIVPREGTPRLELLCAELAPDAQTVRRLQRQMDRQRRANTPDNYDAKGCIKKGHGKGRLRWKQSKRYLTTRRHKATRERRLAAYRKSLHGRMVNEIVALGTTIITEQLSYRAWQKQFGKSMGLRAPGMFIALLRRAVASTGGTLAEVPAHSTKLSRVLSWLWPVRSEAVVAALAKVALWRLRTTRPLLGISGRLFGPTGFSSLVCPTAVRRMPGKVVNPGLYPRIRAHRTTRECGAACASPRHVSPELECVCPKVQAEPHKSPPARKCGGKRGSKARSAPALRGRRGLRARNVHKRACQPEPLRGVFDL